MRMDGNFRVLRTQYGLRIETFAGDVAAYGDGQGVWRIKNSWSLPEDAYRELLALMQALDAGMPLPSHRPLMERLKWHETAVRRDARGRFAKRRMA